LLSFAELILVKVCFVIVSDQLHIQGHPFTQTHNLVQAQETLESEVGSNYDYDDDYSEKVHFPSRAATVPTFSVTFGSGSEVPPPNQMKFGPPRLPKAESQPANNNRTYAGGLPLGRTETGSSSGSESALKGTRWIIE
jgi:hypothetical protein